MKKILMGAAGLALLAAPLPASAQSRGHGGGFHGGGGSGGFSGGSARSGGGFHSEAVGAGGGYQSARAYGGYRGGYRGYGYRGGYHGWRGGGSAYGYYGFGLGLALGLDYGFGYPWYYGYPAYAYFPGYYDYDYGYARDDRTYRVSDAGDTRDWPFNDRVAQGPAPGDNLSGTCGRWVWDSSQSQYHWTQNACAAGGKPQN